MENARYCQVQFKLYVIRYNVLNDESSFVLGCINHLNNTRTMPWPGLSYEASSDEGQALLRSPNGLTYSISEWRTSASVAESLGSTNSFYHSSISSLSTQSYVHIELNSDSEFSSVSFLHVRALCPVPPQFPQRRRAGWAVP
jgi:hypothetical protein